MKEGNASGAKGPWAVTGMQRTEAGTLWPEQFVVSERAELRSKLDERRGMQANA
jgi:hypothetical protein